MRVVITGGAGFIGSHLCDRLLEEGHAIVCVDNFITGSKANIAHLASHSSFQAVSHDVTKPLELSGTIDYVLHFAAPASPIGAVERIQISTARIRIFTGVLTG